MHYTLCDLFSDLTQNAVEAGADFVKVRMEAGASAVSLAIEDNGKGMSPDELARATDPFYTDGVKHPGRKIGLGIPFLIQTAESTGGFWKIESAKAGESDKPGTRVECRFDLTNIDTPPTGDVPGFFRHVLTFDGRYEMEIAYRKEGQGGSGTVEFTVLRSELLEALGLAEEGGFYDANAIVLLGQFIESLMEE